MSLISKIRIGSTDHEIASTAYGECGTAESTAAKTASITGFVLTKGVTVYIKFTNKNSASNPTLNINSTGAKAIMKYGTTAATS
jgi:hypothetical protein